MLISNHPGQEMHGWTEKLNHATYKIPLIISRTWRALMGPNTEIFNIFLSPSSLPGAGARKVFTLIDLFDSSFSCIIFNFDALPLIDKRQD